MVRVKKTSQKTLSLLDAILILFQPLRVPNFASSTPGYRGMMIGLTSTPPGKKRNKELDAYTAERIWEHNLAFVCGLYTLIPPNNSVLKAEAEKLLLSMFGKGIARDRVARFNAAERKRIRKGGAAAWRLVEKLRRHYGFPQ